MRAQSILIQAWPDPEVRIQFWSSLFHFLQILAQCSVLISSGSLSK